MLANDLNEAEVRRLVPDDDEVRRTRSEWSPVIELEEERRPLGEVVLVVDVVAVRRGGTSICLSESDVFRSRGSRATWKVPGGGRMLTGRDFP